MDYIGNFQIISKYKLTCKIKVNICTSNLVRERTKNTIESFFIMSTDFSPGKTTTVEIDVRADQPVRHYNVHLPVDYPNNRGHAVIFSFHGHTRDMTTQEDLSQLSQQGLLINGVGIIAVYPQGIIGTNGGTAWQGAPYSSPHVDDVNLFDFFLFMTSIIHHIDSLCKCNDLRVEKKIVH